jgi:hypothetical protein
MSPLPSLLLIARALGPGETFAEMVRAYLRRPSEEHSAAVDRAEVVSEAVEAGEQAPPATTPWRPADTRRGVP